MGVVPATVASVTDQRSTSKREEALGWEKIAEQCRFIVFG